MSNKLPLLTIGCQAETWHQILTNSNSQDLTPAVVGLYIHLPFCRVRCPFCDFVVVTRLRPQMQRYLAAVVREMERHAGLAVRTIYLGGGTPSILAGEQVIWLMSQIRRVFALAAEAEVSLEANPEDVQPASLQAWQQAGINRISLGVQSFHTRILQRLGRAYAGETAIERVTLARASRITNLNLDLMYGVPGQRLEDWQRDLETAVALAPEHLSLYGLTIEPDTAFANHGVAVDEDLQADMYDWAMGFLPAQGYEQYELSNFAKPGYHSRHNLGYWRSEPSLGIGVGAWSFLNGVRSRNATSFQEYLHRVEGGRETWVEHDELPPDQRRREGVILALRVREGVPADQMDGGARETLQRFVGYGLVELAEGRFRLTPTGRRLSNQVFCELV